MPVLALVSLCLKHSSLRQACGSLLLLLQVGILTTFSECFPGQPISFASTPWAPVPSSLLDFSPEPLSPSKIPMFFILFYLIFILFPSLDSKHYEIRGFTSCPQHQNNVQHKWMLYKYLLNEWMMSHFCYSGFSVRNVLWCSLARKSEVHQFCISRALCPSVWALDCRCC